jgi:Domain of unknown function (DUF4173)
MTHSNARKLLLLAVVAGACGDYLLRGSAWRAGFAVWISLIAVAVLLLGGDNSREQRLMLGGTVLAAFGLVLRDAEMLYAMDMLSVLSMGALLLWRGTGRQLADLTLVEAPRAGVLAVLNTLGGTPGAIRESVADAGATTEERARVRSLAIGGALAVPPVVVVASLLASSDTVFNGLMDRVFSTVIRDGFTHLVVISALAWIAASWLRAMRGDAVGRGAPSARTPGLPFATVGVVVYALLLLLTAFLATQARVVFGGEAFLRETAGLTVATYARDGFFQSIVAAGVVLGTLVLAEWMLGTHEPTGRDHLRIVSGIVLALVAVLLVSAAVKISLYVNEFGLTPDRLFARAGIVWVLCALVVFAMTTLRQSTAQFAPTMVLVTIGWVTVMNVINPEAMVVRANMARVASGHSFDVQFHATLSADAVPALRAAAKRLPAASCQELDRTLRAVWTKRTTGSEPVPRGWRSDDIARASVVRWLREPVASECGVSTGVVSR